LKLQNINDHQIGPILYIGAILPSRSETFVYREVLALRDDGVEVIVASVHRPERNLGSPKTDALEREAIRIYEKGGGRLLFDALHSIIRNPFRSVQVISQAFLDAASIKKCTLMQRVKIMWQCLAAMALARRVRGRRIKHIHAHMAHVPATIAMYCSKQLGTTFSFTGHAADLFVQRTLLEEKLKRSSFTACISNWHRKFYQGLVKLPDENFPIVRCGVDTAEFSPTERSKKVSRFQVLAVGRLVEKKGFDILIESIAALEKKQIEFDCSIVGDGPQRDTLEKLISRNHLKSRVRLLGAKDNGEIRSLLNNCDLFVLPCRVGTSGDKDGIPVVLMEAMACEVCVISGDIETIRELVISEKTGLMVAPGVREDLTQGMQRLIEDDKLRDRLSKAGREWVVREFSIQQTVKKLEEAFVGR